MPPATPTVFVIEDDPSTRTIYEGVISGAGHRVQCYASAVEFLHSSSFQNPCGCLLLDIKRLGLEHQQMLATRTPLPLIIVSDRDDVRTAVEAMKSGAIDYLSKPVNSNDLLRAIELAISQSAHREQRRAQLEAVTFRLTTLTPREREVMLLVVRGLPNKQIAGTLGAAEKTIKVHRGRVMAKMQVQSVAQLVHDVESARDTWYPAPQDKLGLPLI